MNRRQLLKGLICAPIAGAAVAKSPRECPEPEFSLVQPKAEGSDIPYDNTLRIYPNSQDAYAEFYHDGTDLIITNSKTGRQLKI